MRRMSHRGTRLATVCATVAPPALQAPWPVRSILMGGLIAACAGQSLDLIPVPPQDPLGGGGGGIAVEQRVHPLHRSEGPDEDGRA